MHDVELAQRFADRIVGMRGGRIVFDGPPAELTDDDADDDLRRRRLAAVTRPAAPQRRGTDPGASARDADPPIPFPRQPVWPRVAAVALVVYVVYACAQIEVSWERVETGLANAAHFFSRLFPPNFTRWDLLVKGLRESLQIAVLASTLGIVLALPIGLCAARNLMPAWVTWPARSSSSRRARSIR